MPSFDVVSEADDHEVQNAYDQTVRELNNRYDFQGTGVSCEKTPTGFRIVANSEDRVLAAITVLEDKWVKRKLSLKFLDKGEPQPAGGQTFQVDVTLKKGIDKDNAKKIVQKVKGEKKLKVTPAVQGDSVRVTGKKRDDLQACIAMLKAEDLPIAVAFQNFRD